MRWDSIPRQFEKTENLKSHQFQWELWNDPWKDLYASFSWSCQRFIIQRFLVCLSDIMCLFLLSNDVSVISLTITCQFLRFKRSFNSSKRYFNHIPVQSYQAFRIFCSKSTKPWRENHLSWKWIESDNKSLLVKLFPDDVFLNYPLNEMWRFWWEFSQLRCFPCVCCRKLSVIYHQAEPVASSFNFNMLHCYMNDCIISEHYRNTYTLQHYSLHVFNHIN